MNMQYCLCYQLKSESQRP